jgi:regulator of replication initiation timing
MSNEVMKIIAEQIGALVITNANMVAKITELQIEIENLKKTLSETSNQEVA